jgi:signal transduction histidine kinase
VDVVAGVLGMLDLLLLTMLTPEQAGYVRVMQGSAEGLMQVLNEILDFSKIQSGHLALDIVDFHIGEVLDQVHLETPFVVSTTSQSCIQYGKVSLFFCRTVSNCQSLEQVVLPVD